MTNKNKATTQPASPLKKFFLWLTAFAEAMDADPLLLHERRIADLEARVANLNARDC